MSIRVLFALMRINMKNNVTMYKQMVGCIFPNKLNSTTRIQILQIIFCAALIKKLI